MTNLSDHPTPEGAHPCDPGRAQTGVIKLAPFGRTSRGRVNYSLFPTSSHSRPHSSRATTSPAISFSATGAAAASRIDQRQGYALAQGEVHGQRLKRGRGRMMMITGGGVTVYTGQK